MTAEGTAGGGMVKATVKGDMTVQSVKIDKIVVNPDDTEMLEDWWSPPSTTPSAR